MKPPRKPAGPAFDRAADALEALRQQQIAALTENQRALYDQACRKAKEREKAKAADLEKRRHSDIQEAMRKRRLQKPQPELRLRVKGDKLMELLAKKQIADQIGDNRASSTSNIDKFIEKEIKRYATAEVERAHMRERDLLRTQQRRSLDELLQRFEHARGSKDIALSDFGRAGVKGKAKADLEKAGGSNVIPKSDAIARAIARVQQKEKTKGEFEKAAKGDGTRPEPVKSDAIARAIAKVKAKEDEKRQRGDRGQGRERLTDTFNRTR